MVECIDRMELIQARGGGSAKVQIDGYAVAERLRRDARVKLAHDDASAFPR
jgi:hypothetical protein